MQKPDLKYAFGLPPEKAIEYFKSKGYKFSWDWQDLWQEAHAKAFTVAKVTRMDVLQSIRDALLKSKKEGLPFQQFQKNLLPTLAQKGWGPSGVNMETMKLADPWRMKTIYETNMQTALNVGRYKFDIGNVDNRPYWMYVAVLDSRTRPAHAALNGKVFRYDDPFWDHFYPPNGFRCRCRVRTVSGQDMKERNLSLESSEGKLGSVETLVSKKTGELVDVAQYTDPFTGMKISPDAGWNYNPGKAAWQPDLDSYDYSIAKQYIEGSVTGPDFKQFFKGAIKGIFPVAVLNEEFKKAIGSESQVVNLSDETLKKNLEKHPEITRDIYQRLPDIIEKAQLVVQDGENTFVFFKMNGEVYYGSVKSTQTGQANFLTSLRVARQSDIETIKKKGKILRNEL